MILEFVDLESTKAVEAHKGWAQKPVISKAITPFIGIITPVISSYPFIRPFFYGPITPFITGFLGPSCKVHVFFLIFDLHSLHRSSSVFV